MCSLAAAQAACSRWVFPEPAGPHTQVRPEAAPRATRCTCCSASALCAGRKLAKTARSAKRTPRGICRMPRASGDMRRLVPGAPGEYLQVVEPGEHRGGECEERECVEHLARRHAEARPEHHEHHVEQLRRGVDLAEA